MTKPTFADVAKLIGDPQLAEPLARLASEIKTEVDNTDFITKPTEVKRDIERLERETRRFEIALSRISKRLLDLPIDADQSLKKAKEAITGIVELCNKSLAIISPKRGAPKKPGRVTCALIVIEAFTLVKDRVPGANNPDVQSACEDYWQACGGHASDPANWRRTIKSALADHSHWRRHIRNQLRRGTK
jgi:hypothetical protein